MDWDLLLQSKEAWKRGGPECGPSGYSELHPFSFLVMSPLNGFEPLALAVYISKTVIHWGLLRSCEHLCWVMGTRRLKHSSGPQLPNWWGR